MLKLVLLLFVSGATLLAQPRASGAAPAVAPDPAPATNSAGFRLEREPVAGHAELVTLFGRLQDPASGADSLDVPVLSVLRDTLGDANPGSDRLRYVWILTSTRPTLWQQAASALSFFRFRAGSRQHDNRVPAAVLDLASPGKTVWTNLLGNGLQSTQFDPLGVLVRASTRSYRGNSSDYRKVHVFQALSALDGLERETGGQGLLPDSDLREIYSRLSLSDRTFGGLVRQKNLPKAYEKETTRREQARGRNWELLRQRAELTGLYFEPLALPDATPTQAVLWVAREDLEQRQGQSFERQFLNIANPWTDERLLNWTGYTEVRWLDAEQRPVSADRPGARPVELIPLAFYSLDYPRVPLLLADFRDTFKPKRGELVRHAATTALTSVFGITRFGNWPFLAADSAWNFVRGRHGVAVDRAARLRAYSEAREFLALDAALDPKFKTELLRRLDHLALNPLENGISAEATMAKEQYAVLLQYAVSPEGLGAKLQRDRRKELASYTQSRARRFLAGIGSVLTGGFLAGSQNSDRNLVAELASHRRVERHMRFLDQLLAASPRPEVVWDPGQIRQSIDALSAESGAPPRVARLIAEVFARSSDSELRFACLRGLQRLNFEQARNELWRLSQDPDTGESWRALCLLYFNGDTAPGQIVAAGGGE